MDPVVHFEMPYENRERMAKFYASAFGWKMQMLGEEMDHYVLATTAESDAKPGASAGAINGGFFPKKGDKPDQVPSIVIGVRDIRESMEKIKQAGGRVLAEPMEIPGYGRFVPFLDTEGNRCSAIQPLPGM